MNNILWYIFFLILFCSILGSIKILADLTKKNKQLKDEIDLKLSSDIYTKYFKGKHGKHT